jgi:acetyltransferase-like isoleucine patch superfamily enzyme
MDSLFQALKTRWKVWNYIHSLLCHPVVRLSFFINSIPWGRGWAFYGLPIIQKHWNSSIRFGDGLQLRSSVRSNPFGVNHPVIICTFRENALLVVGDNFRMSGGSISVTEKITIGNNVLVGANTTIMDSDFHPSHPEERSRNPNQGQSTPTVIGDDVFIGANSFILRGVTVGSRSVIGTGSVVTADIKPGSIVFGNPARILRAIN